MPAIPDPFTGFPATATGLLDRLPDFSRDDYAAAKPEIDATLLTPAKAFVPAMVDALHDAISPTIAGQPKVNGLISPLNNDLRFAAPGTPTYKDHLLIWFWDGPSKKTSPLLAVRIAPDGVGFGVGMGFDKDRLDRWRAFLDTEPGVEFGRWVAKQAGTVDVAGDQLKRVPKPHGDDHPNADLLRYKSVQLRWSEPVPASFGRSAFVGWCTTRLARLAPLHRVLVDEVA